MDKLQRLIKDLSSKKESVRADACDSLRWIRDEVATAALMRALKDESWYVRERAARALGEVRTVDSAGALFEAVLSEDYLTGSDIIRALEQIGVEGLPSFIKAFSSHLGDEGWEMQRTIEKLPGDFKECASILRYWENYKEDTLRRYIEREPKIADVLMEILPKLPARLRPHIAVALTSRKENRLIPRLVELIHSMRPESEDESYLMGIERAVYTTILGVFGDSQCIPALSGLLQDESSQVRAAAAVALGKIGSPYGVEALVKAADDKNDGLREAAIWALGSAEVPPAQADTVSGTALRLDQSALKEKITAALLRASHDTVGPVRCMAIWALGSRGVQEAVEALKAMLKEDSPKVRAAAVRSLGKLHNPSAAAALSEAMHDPVEDVQSMAVWALGEIGHTASIPMLVSILEGILDKTGGAKVVGEADYAVSKLAALWIDDTPPRPWNYSRELGPTTIEALGKMGGRAAEQVLLRAASCNNEHLRTTALSVLNGMKVDSLEALEREGGVADFDVLNDALSGEDKRLAEVAARMAGRSGDRRYIEPLRIRAEKSYYGEGPKLAAIEALARLRDETAGQLLTSELRELLHSSQYRSAVTFLGSLGYRDAIPRLLAFLDDPDPQVIDTVTQALDALGEGDLAYAIFGSLKGDGQAFALLRELAEKDPEEAANPFRNFLHSDDVDVRIRAAEALGYIPAENAASALESGYSWREEDEDVRLAIVRSLAQLGPIAVDAAWTLVDNLADSPSRLRTASFDALVSIGVGAIPDLVSGITKILKEDTGRWPWRQRHNVLTLLLTALMEIFERDEIQGADPEVITALEKLVPALRRHRWPWARDLPPEVKSKVLQTFRIVNNALKEIS